MLIAFHIADANSLKGLASIVLELFSVEIHRFAGCRVNHFIYATFSTSGLALPLRLG